MVVKILICENTNNRGLLVLVKTRNAGIFCLYLALPQSQKFSTFLRQHNVTMNNYQPVTSKFDQKHFSTEQYYKFLLLIEYNTNPALSIIYFSRYAINWTQTTFRNSKHSMELTNGEALFLIHRLSPLYIQSFYPLLSFRQIYQCKKSIPST